MLIKLVVRNALRHKLRTGLTVAGMVVVISAFGLMQTVVDAWYGGVNAASSDRLVTRHKVSLNFAMPLTHINKIRGVDGVKSVAAANWFGGIYRDQSMNNFFPKFAVDAEPYFAMYPEYVVRENEFRDFLRDRKGALIGRKLANAHGFKVGDVIPVQGDIFPGNWEFVVRGIYEPGQASTDTSALFFHYEYLNESLRQRNLRRSDLVGVFVSSIDDVGRAAEISKAIDLTSENSAAETLTETEKAFQIGFAKQTETIVVIIRYFSYVVIFIIFTIMANVISLTASERMAEYATFKALGFKPLFVANLILAESLVIAVIGAALGIALTFPITAVFGNAVGNLFPIFALSSETIRFQVLWAVVVGIAAGLLPMRRAARVNIVEGLRHIG
jgi:putative ABC transport system permease protein